MHTFYGFCWKWEHLWNRLLFAWYKIEEDGIKTSEEIFEKRMKLQNHDEKNITKHFLFTLF